MMAIIASYFLNDNWFTSAAPSMIPIDAMVKLNLTQPGACEIHAPVAFALTLSREVFYKCAINNMCPT
jgi:hypothetical protein